MVDCHLFDFFFYVFHLQSVAEHDVIPSLDHSKILQNKVRESSVVPVVLPLLPAPPPRNESKLDKEGAPVGPVSDSAKNKGGEVGIVG